MLGFLSRLRLRLRVLFDRRHDQALREELEFHVEQLAAQQRRAGLGHDEALAAARRQFGNLTRIQEQSHDLFAFRHVEDLLKDLRYGARLLVKHPGFSLIAMLSIAIGVGANAAMFSFADGQVLRPLRVPRPGEVVAVSAVAPRVTEGFLSNRLSYPDYRDVRERRQVVPEGYELPEGMESVTVFAARIDEGYLDAMEIPVVSGRGILETDTDESPRVVLVNQTLAARYWPEQDPVGRRLRFVGRETESWVEVVGVTADSRYNWIGEASTPFLYVSQMQAAAVRAAAGITQGGAAPSSSQPTPTRRRWRLRYARSCRSST